MEEDDQCVVVVIVVVGAVFVVVVVVGFSRVCCLSGCCWFGCRRRDDRGRGFCWSFESDAQEVAFQGIPSQAVSCRGGVEIDVVFPSLGWSSLLPTALFCWSDIAGLHLEMSFVQRPSECLGSILACF